MLEFKTLIENSSLLYWYKRRFKYLFFIKFYVYLSQRYYIKETITIISSNPSCLFETMQKFAEINPYGTFHFLSELGTLEWETINPDCLIRIFNVDTFNFFLNHSFFTCSPKKSKTCFSKFKSPSRFYY